METYLNDPIIKKLVIALLSILVLLFAIMTVSYIKGYGSIGQSVYPSRTISVNGTGEVVAVPDIALINMTVEAENKDVATAQSESAEKINAIIDFLKSENIDEEDIKTTSYNISPQYDYVSEICPMGFSCPGGKQQLRGYSITQTLEVKVRDTKNAGTILSGIGDKGATNVYGPNFQIDDNDILLEEAREKAIKDARLEARRLADSLGVRLGDVVSFSSNDFPYYERYGIGGDMVSAPTSAKVVPELPTGENIITANITITYEIR